MKYIYIEYSLICAHKLVTVYICYKSLMNTFIYYSDFIQLCHRSHLVRQELYKMNVSEMAGIDTHRNGKRFIKFITILFFLLRFV